MKTRYGPDGRRFEFPDDTPEAEMKAALAKEYPKQDHQQINYGSAPLDTNPLVASIKGAAAGVVQGLTANFADEIAAGVGTAAGAGRYDENQKAIEAAFNRARDDAPGSYMGGLIGGGIVGPGKAMKAAEGISMLPRLAPAVKNIAQGAGLGALYGAGEDSEDRLNGMMAGGALGGIGGAAVPAGMLGLQALGRSIADTVQPARSVGMRNLYNAVVRDNKTIAQAQAELNALGKGAVIADLGGNVTGLAEASAQQMGKSLKAAEYLRQRAGGAGERLKNAALDAVGVRSVDELIASRQAASQPLYDAVMKPENVVNIRGMDSDAQALLKMATDAVKNHKVLGPQFRDVPDNALPLVDEAKKFIDDMIRSSQRAGNNNEARILTEAKSKILQRADHQFPDYKKAREAWGGPQDTIDALEMIESTADNAADFSDVAKKLFGKPSVRAELQKLLPGAAFNKFVSAVERERTFADTYKAVTGNSRTAFRQAAQEDMAPTAPELMIQQPSAMGILYGIARGIGNSMKRPATETADELAAPLFSPDPAVQQSAFQELSRRTALGSILQRPSVATLTGGARIGGYLGGSLGGSNQ
jgi:hypothetical protein